MRILRLYHIHPCYFDIDEFLTIHATQSYTDLLNLLAKELIIVPAEFVPSMKSLGCEAQDCIVNNTFLLKKWCKEQDEKFQGNLETVDRIISLYKPDVLFLERDTFNLPISFKKGLKKRQPSVKIVATRWGAQTSNELLPLFKGTDIAFAIDKPLSITLSKVIPKVHVCRPGIDIGSFKPGVKKNKKYSFTFLGSTGHGLKDHQQRYYLLKELVKTTPLTIFGNEPFKKWWSLSSKPYFPLLQMMTNNGLQNILLIFSHLLGGRVHSTCNKVVNRLELFRLATSQVPLAYQIPQKMRPALFGKAYLDTLSESKVSLNIHVDQKDLSGNFRTFEATAAGSCLLTDRAEWMKDEFQIEKEIVPYTNIDEAREKFVYLQNNPLKCEEIALAGQKRTLSQHTTYHRCKYIKDKMEQFLS